MSKKIDLTGQRFGRLVVLCENGRTKDSRVLWLCKCQCGAEVTVSGKSLRNGETASCGCLHRDLLSERSKTHGMRKSRIYSVWHGILKRTGIHKGANEEHKRDYIDRGIAVCDEWKTFENFRDWALSHNYSDGLQIDRIDNDKGYCPENCRFVSCRENVNNRRNTLRLPDGKPLAIFCSEIGIQTRENGKESKLYNRICLMYRTYHKGHPELIRRANELIALYRKTLEMRELLNEVRAFRASP